MTTKELVVLFLSKPIQENFDLIKENRLAMLLVCKSSTDVFDFLKTFEDWEIVYQDSGSDLESLALQKMSEFEKTFEEWKIVYQNSDYAIKMLAIQKMDEFEKTFEE